MATVASVLVGAVATVVLTVAQPTLNGELIVEQERTDVKHASLIVTSKVIRGTRAEHAASMRFIGSIVAVLLTIAFPAAGNADSIRDTRELVACALFRLEVDLQMNRLKTVAAQASSSDPSEQSI